LEKDSAKKEIHEGNGKTTNHCSFLMTLEEVEARWHLHQAVSKCASTQIETLKLDDKIIGFKCGCGYTFKNANP